jgi:FOG: WD40 repeat
LATGHETNGAAKVEAIVWDLENAVTACLKGDNIDQEKFLLHRLLQHHGKVQALDFSCDDDYLVTLGGQDDNDLVVWDVLSGKGICGTKAANDVSFCVKWLNRRNDRFVTCGNFHFRVWQVCTATPKLHAVDANMGTMKRVMKCLSISEDDSFGFAGSKTGEVLKFRIDRDDIKPPEDPDDKHPGLLGYSRERLTKGIKAVACVINPLTGNTNIIAGAGDGTLQMLNPNLQSFPSHNVQLQGGITSISLDKESKSFIVGTDMSQRYSLDIKTFTPELRGSCHYADVFDVKYPKDSSDLFVTASFEDIRVWHVKKKQELLRIKIPNATCHAIDITQSGTSIISAWSDGKIRSFLPQSGKAKFVIPDAHPDEVTAITTCNDDDLESNWRLVSGGKDGSIRVWIVTTSHQRLHHSMKEHRGAINALTSNKNGTQVVSASSDGSCIVWDLQKGIRIHALFENAVFTDMKFHPEEYQYLTCGTNCKISYWDAYDGSTIRVIDGGNAAMTSLCIVPNGDYFVSGSADKTVKLWHYDEGTVQQIGYGHSGLINSVAISPDTKSVVSVGSEGGIFIWSLPLIT